MWRIFPVSIICVLFTTGCARETGMDRHNRYSRTEPLMGTFVRIIVPERRRTNGEPPGDAVKAVNGAFQLASALEKKFNIYDPKSEINGLNIAKDRSVSPELFDLVQKAKNMSRLTNGAFDMTVAPILKAEGFYENMPGYILEEIPGEFDGKGWEGVVLSSDRTNVALGDGVWMDLSGIAKGYIVDRMADLLRGKGIRRFLINAGGDIYCGRKKGHGKWMIGLRAPGTEKILLTLAVEEMAVATSGDYENWVVDESTGKASSHIMDPSRQAAVEKRFSSVTVITRTCTEADALATGMMAMGRDKVIALVDTIGGVEAIVVTSDGKGGHSVDRSGGAREYMAGGQK